MTAAFDVTSVSRTHAGQRKHAHQLARREAEVVTLLDFAGARTYALSLMCQRREQPRLRNRPSRKPRRADRLGDDQRFHPA